MSLRARRKSALALALALALSQWACGYAMKTSRNRTLEKRGIRTLYIAPVVNDSFKAGVENTVYNQVLRRIMIQKNVKLSRDPIKSDAQLKARVTRAAMNISTTSSTQSLPPEGNQEFRQRIGIATHYNASLSVTFELMKDNKVIWDGSFGDNKRFQSSVSLGTQGVTTALIDDSTFDQALDDLAADIASDLHESMFADF